MSNSREVKETPRFVCPHGEIDGCTPCLEAFTGVPVTTEYQDAVMAMLNGDSHD